MMSESMKRFCDAANILVALNNFPAVIQSVAGSWLVGIGLVGSSLVHQRGHCPRWFFVLRTPAFDGANPAAANSFLFFSKPPLTCNKRLSFSI